MKRIWILIPFILLTGCLEKDITKLDIEMVNIQGDSVGKVTLQEMSSGVKMKFN